MNDEPSKRERVASTGLRRDIDELLAQAQASLEQARTSWPGDREKAIEAADELRVRSKELRDGIVVASREDTPDGEPVTWKRIAEILGIKVGAASAMFGGSWADVREANRERNTSRRVASHAVREEFPEWSLQEAADVCGISVNSMHKRGGGKTVYDESGAPHPGGRVFPGVHVSFYQRRSGKWVTRYMVDEDLVVNREKVPERDRHRFPHLFPQG